MMVKTRVSIGTAIALGLRKGSQGHPPTTAYVMVGERCSSNCSFCSQARDATSHDGMLSRITWPEFGEEEIVRALSGAGQRGIGRVCLQVLTEAEAISGLPDLVRRVHVASGLPISISIVPIPVRTMEVLKDAGAERIGIALDAPSERVFDAVKGMSRGNPYSFEGHWRSLREAVKVFGRSKVSTHLIVGMGETDEELYDAMVKARENGIIVSLFAYTHVEGTERIADPPPLGRYRALQVLRHLIFDLGKMSEPPKFRDDGKLIGSDRSLIEALNGSGAIFATRGCPDCNRPYYTERPRGPIYNHPDDPGIEEFRRGLEEARAYVRD